jgi:hypothetical protein
MNSPEALRVRHHVLLQRLGGASNLARLLHETLLAMGARSEFTFEVPRPAGEGGPADPAVEYACPVDALARCPGDGIVHLHATSAPDEALAVLAAAGAPTVVTAHDCAWLTGGCVYPLDCEGWRAGCPPPCPQGIENARAVCGRRRDGLRALNPVVVSPSRWLGDMLGEAVPGLSVRVIANATSPVTSCVAKTKAKAAFGIGPRAKVVLFLAHGGALAGYKGGAAFQAIWEAIGQAAPDAVGIIAGGSGQGRRDRCITLPYLDAAHRDGVFAAADVLLYPSLADNAPLVILEAMARRVPVVAFAVGGIPEQIVSGESGMLVAPGDYPALVETALAVLSRPSLARSLARKAALAVGERFAPEQMARRYLGAYRDLLTS